MIPFSKHDQENAISEVQGWFETVNHPSYCEGQWTQFVFDPSSIKASLCVQAFLPLSKRVFKGLKYIQKVVIVDVVGPEMIHSGLIFIGALIVRTEVIAHF